MGSDRSWEDLLDMTSNEPEPIDSRRLFLGVGWTLHIFLLCLFLPAGNWAGARGWLFFVVVVVVAGLTHHNSRAYASQ